MQRLEEMGDGGQVPSAHPREGPFSSLHPLVLAELFQSITFVSRRGFFPAIADVSKPGLQTRDPPTSSLCRELCWEMDISRLSSADRTPGRGPVPAPCRGRAAGGGRVGAARGLQLVPVGVVPVPSCGNWENIRENTSVLGWVQGLETLPGEWEGCWALPRVRALPSPAGCCPSAFLLLLILIEGEGNGVSLGGRGSQHSNPAPWYRRLVTKPCVATEVRALRG